MKNTTNTDNQTILLCNGTSVHPEFLSCIHIAAKDRIPVLTPNVAFSAKQICGKDFWSMLTPGEQKMAGSCMVHLVEKQELPMSSVESSHEYPKHYQLK